MPRDVISNIAIIVSVLYPLVAVRAQENSYNWLARIDSTNTVAARIAAPRGYERVSAEPESFGAWLRGLPLKAGRPAVMLFNGKRKVNQEAHHAVIDIDVGVADLQQCADAVMRLRAEYLRSTNQWDKIRFKFTNGDMASYSRWIAGYRPLIRGNDSRWLKSAPVDSSYANFREYLDCVFLYAGSLSLSRELAKVDNPEEIEIGDVFIQGGTPGTNKPGHAVIVLEVARNSLTGRSIFILAQSYMPAQDIHILRNPRDPILSPWYPVLPSGPLHTPEWEFEYGDLRRFR